MTDEPTTIYGEVGKPLQADFGGKRHAVVGRANAKSALDALAKGPPIAESSENYVAIKIRKRPFLSRLWRHYRAYRDSKSFNMGRLSAFRVAWRLAST